MSDCRVFHSRTSTERRQRIAFAADARLIIFEAISIFTFDLVPLELYIHTAHHDDFARNQLRKGLYLSCTSALKTVLGFFILSLTSLVILSATESKAEASESLRGFIHLVSGELTVVLKTSAAPFKLTSSSGLLSNLSALHEGDYVIMTGNIDLRNHIVDVEEIESIGLQALLGIWRTQQWQVFEFRDFNRLNLYSSTMSPPSSVGLEKLRQFSYILAPNADNKFTIILTDDKDVHTGLIELSEQSVHIQLFDSKTGLVAQDISLLPVPLN